MNHRPLDPIVDHSQSTETMTLKEFVIEKGTTIHMGYKWAKREDWPRPVGSRAKARLYARADLDAAYRRMVRLPEPEGSPDDLLTWPEVVAYLGKGGTSPETLRWRRWKGRVSESVVGADGVERWPRSVVEADHERVTRGRKPKS